MKRILQGLRMFAGLVLALCGLLGVLVCAVAFCGFLVTGLIAGALPVAKLCLSAGGFVLSYLAADYSVAVLG